MSEVREIFDVTEDEMKTALAVMAALAGATIQLFTSALKEKGITDPATINCHDNMAAVLNAASLLQKTLEIQSDESPDQKEGEPT